MMNKNEPSAGNTMRVRSKVYAASEGDKPNVPENESGAGVGDDVIADLKQATTHDRIKLKNTFSVKGEVSENSEKFVPSIWLWVLLLGVLTVVGFGITDSLQYLLSLWEASPLWSSLLIFLSGAFWSSVLFLIVREIIGYWRTLEIDKAKVYAEHLSDLLQQDDGSLLVDALLPRLKALRRSPIARSWVEQFESSIKPDYNAKQVWKIYQTKVEQPLEEHSRTLMSQEMKKAAAITFISPNDSFQNLVLLWRSVILLRRVCEVYGTRPGAVGTAHLIKVTLQNVITENIVDMGVESFAKEMGNVISAKILEQGATATTASLLIYRVGSQLIQMLKLDTTD